MCGRYTLTVGDGRLIADRFDVRAFGLAPATLGRFNVCPTERVAAVCAERGSRVARDVRWGLVPPWARAAGAGPEPINARAETAAERRPFAELLPRAERRCLLPADGWYEWLRPEREGGERVPFRYTVQDGAAFAFAALWDVRRIEGEEIASAAILTTAANAVCAAVHDRMPCVLAGAEEEAAWLNDDCGLEDLAQLLAPLPAGRTTAAPANPAVNRAGVEGAHLLTPTVAESAQLRFGI